jgi:transcriptional regulator with XRE-family HTH domain
MPRKLPQFNPLLSLEVGSPKDLGLLVRNHRALASMRLDDVASLCFVSSDLLSRLENGGAVTTDKLLSVLAGLGLKMLIVPAAESAQLKLQLEVLAEETLKDRNG